jgi:hypothetical protein
MKKWNPLSFIELDLFNVTEMKTILFGWDAILSQPSTLLAASELVPCRAPVKIPVNIKYLFL